MNCRDIDFLLSNQDRLEPANLPPAGRDHVRECARCRDLTALLEREARIPDAARALLGGLEHRLQADLKPVVPLPSAAFLTAGFTALFAAVVAFGGYRLKAMAISAVSVPQGAAVAGVLVLGAVLLAGSLPRQMAPGSHHRWSPVQLVFAVVLAVLTAFSAVFPFGETPSFLKSGVKCLSTGIVFAAVAAGLFWMLLRRGEFVSPRLGGATAGLLAGLAGAGVLQIHCPLLEAWHIVTWHVGTLVLSALAGFAVAGLCEKAATWHAAPG